MRFDQEPPPVRLALTSLAEHRFLEALAGRKIVLACGNPLLLSALAYDPGLKKHLVAAVTTEAEAVEAVSKLFADFVIATDHLEAGHGTHLLGHFDHLRTLLFLDSNSPAAIQEAVEAGVDGIVPLSSLQPDGSGGAIQAIAAVGKGGTWVPKAVSEVVSRSDAHALEMCEKMTRAEREILSELGKGLTNDEIAQKLVVSEETVKSHLKSVRQKLGFSDRVKLALVAIHAGL